MSPRELEPEVVSNLYPEPETMADSESDVEPLFELEVGLVGESISVRSSSDSEAVAMYVFTFRGVTLVAQDDVGGVCLPRGM